MFVFKFNYKRYNDSPKASLVNLACSYIATIAIWGGVIAIAVSIFDSSVPEETVVGGFVALVGGAALRFYKDRLTDRIAWKEQAGSRTPEVPPSKERLLGESEDSKPQEARTQAEEDVKFCTQCGARNPEDARFCTKCGSRF